jgi:F0F1-type ATP synthase epsilon subunit
MAEKLFLEVVTPQKAIIGEEAEMVVAPGSEGEFGALKGHTTTVFGFQRFRAKKYFFETQ